MKINPTVMMQREPDDTGIVFVPEQNRAFSLNEAAVIIWEEIEQGSSEREIVDRLIARFNAEACQVRDDLNEFLSKLKHMNLLSLT